VCVCVCECVGQLEEDGAKKKRVRNHRRAACNMFAVERQTTSIERRTSNIERGADEECVGFYLPLTKTGILITRSTISEIRRAASVVVQVRLIWLICDFQCFDGLVNYQKHRDN